MVLRTLTVATLSLVLMEALATQVILEPFESVLERAGAALVVDIERVSEVVEDPMWRVIDFEAIARDSLFGDIRSGGKLAFRYSEGKPHYRGSLGVSPLTSGSGLEFRVTKGDRVVVLVEVPYQGARPIKVLRIEPEEAASAIRRRKRED